MFLMISHIILVENPWEKSEFYSQSKSLELQLQDLVKSDSVDIRLDQVLKLQLEALISTVLEFNFPLISDYNIVR